MMRQSRNDKISDFRFQISNFLVASCKTKGFSPYRGKRERGLQPETRNKKIASTELKILDADLFAIEHGVRKFAHEVADNQHLAAAWQHQI